MEHQHLNRLEQRNGELIALISKELENKGRIECERHRREFNNIVADVFKIDGFDNIVPIAHVPRRLRGTSNKPSQADRAKLAEIKSQAELLQLRIKSALSKSALGQPSTAMNSETDQATRAISNLLRWFNSLPPSKVLENKYNAATDAVSVALLETRRYLKHRNEGGREDDKVEARLSELWSRAASEIRPYDLELSYLCEVKGHGWSDQNVWSRSPFKDLPLELDQVIQQLRNSRERHEPAQQSTKLYTKLAQGAVEPSGRTLKMPGKLFYIVAGILTVVVILVLCFGNKLSPIQIQFVRWGCALTAAVILFYYFSSEAGFSGNLLGYAISLGGAAAGFAIIYLLLTYSGSGTRLVTIRLVEEQKPLRIIFRVDVDVPDREPIEKGGERGTTTIQVPHGLTELTSLTVSSDEYEQEGSGPYKIRNDEAIVVMKRKLKQK
jgi:hypothetical protein